MGHVERKEGVGLCEDLIEIKAVPAGTRRQYLLTVPTFAVFPSILTVLRSRSRLVLNGYRTARPISSLL